MYQEKFIEIAQISFLVGASAFVGFALMEMLLTVVWQFMAV